MDDDSKSDVWVDIERIDAFTFETGSGPDYRKFYYSYDWKDFDPKDTETVEYKYITNPTDKKSGSAVSTEKPTDGRDYVKVPIRKALTVETGRGMQFQRTKHTHENGTSNSPDSSRTVHKRRVKHYDVPEKTLDKKGQPPDDPTDYFNALDAKSMDDGQYLDVEVIDDFITTTGSGYTWRKWIWSLGSDADSLLADPLKTKSGASGGDYFPVKPSK
jgi:hypothetical protein